MAERATTAAKRCTSIMLPSFMDYLCLRDLLRSMAVNRFWREHAINHYTYYGDIHLMQHFPPTDPDFFLLRLDRSAGRPVSVWLELGDPNPPSLIEALTNHLHHITSLTLKQSPSQSLAPVLAALCCPAPLLRRLDVEYAPRMFQPTAPPTTWHPTCPIITLLPAEFLGGHAPALAVVSLSDIELPPEMPSCFSNVRSLAFGAQGGNRGLHRLVLPNPFPSCSNLRVLRLSGVVTLDPAAFLARAAWENMSYVSLFGCGLEDNWQSLPIANIPKIHVSGWDLTFAAAAALIETIPGTLEISFQTPQRSRNNGMPSFGESVWFCASWSSVSIPVVTRSLAGDLSANGAGATFSMPSLANRVVRLVLMVTAWDDIVGFSGFGPFSALEEIILNVIYDDAATFSPPSTMLTCPRLKLLVGSIWQRGLQLPADVGRFARFARAALSPEIFPLKLELDGFIIQGPCDDFADTFSSCVTRTTCLNSTATS